MRTVVVEICLLWLIFLSPLCLKAQSTSELDIALRIDYSSAEEMLDLFDRRTFNATRVAQLPGNRIAAATSLLLARTSKPPEDFARELELVRDNYNSSGDLYGLRYTQAHSEKLRKLLAETKKRQLDRRVVATVASYFPPETRLSAVVPVYIVAMGNEKAAAFVRRVAWKDGSPLFVGEREGEQVIVLNMARMAEISSETDGQFVGLLSTLAHECFHTIFGLYQEKSPAWNEYRGRTEPLWTLCNLVVNEGIAYYLSLQLQIGGQSPPTQWFQATEKAMKTLNSALSELGSASLTPQRARELILSSNLSGSFEGNYGATAGLRMAYEIDTKLGRPALTETIRGGIKEFFGKYDALCTQNADLPRLDEAALKVVRQ
jgi:hypothetical protein